MRKLVAIAMVLIGALPGTARAWGNKSAHPAINAEVWDRFVEAFPATDAAGGGRVRLDSSALFVGPGITDGGFIALTTSTGPMVLTMGLWLQHGGFSADEPEIYQSWRHFYDPFGANGPRYLTDHVPDGWGPNPAIDAKRWAIDHPDNPWRWEMAKEYWRQGFEGTVENPGEAFAKAFRAAGETLHLVADMLQPAHVRNDAHPFFEPLEDTVDAAIVHRVASGQADPSVSVAGTIYEVFDALASYSNTRFYSHETLYNASSPAVSPINGQAPNARPQFGELEFDDLTRVFSGWFEGTSASLVMEKYSSWFARNRGYPNESATFMVPAAFAESQAAVLIPIAVQAGTEVFKAFFPVLDLQIRQEAADPSSPGVTRIGGSLVHRVDADPNWSVALRYSGPGRVMRRTHGFDGEPVAPVRFEGGEIAAPAEIEPASLAGGALLYLEVVAGGLILQSADLAVSGSTCGDGTCDYASEGAADCPEDCGYCGDDVCSPPRESAGNCDLDCGTCGDGVCTDGRETRESCVLDCGYCGDDQCTPPRESTDNCARDCAVCGDGACTDAAESEYSCPEDCAVCGDGTCSATENPVNCQDDCGSCGNGTCEPGLDECRLEEISLRVRCMADCCPDNRSVCEGVGDEWCAPF